MTITRGMAAAAMLAGLAVGTASAAWADTTLSGHYVETETGAESGQSITYDWYATSCGDGCASLEFTPGGPIQSQAQLVKGQWILDTTGAPLRCPDGSVVPNAVSEHYTVDSNTLAGTVQLTYEVPACGNPAGHTQTNNLELRQAP